MYHLMDAAAVSDGTTHRFSLAASISPRTAHGQQVAIDPTDMGLFWLRLHDGSQCLKGAWDWGQKVT